ncbi:DUF551 domain-containing protein [Enterobacter cloacae]|uniref:DUF551 domain-containing protein n=1 Tax=Enterobacter cloacae TaxID=550 RepID=UPI003314AC4F
MSTITKEFTKEQLQQIIETDHVQCGEASSLARIALASLEAEPVHQVLTGDAWVDLSKGAMESQKRVGAIVRTVYTAPPAPVSVPDGMTPKQASRAYCGEVRGYRDGWNACRAAMLQSFGNSEQLEPVTTAYKLPDGFDFDRFNDVVWLEAVASNPHMHSLTTSTIAMVALELNRKLAAGNSPAIPDGWVACSERMPEVGVKVLCFPVNDEPIHATYNGQVWLQDISWSTSDEPIDNVISCNVFHWMPLPAAPQQE